MTELRTLDPTRLLDTLESEGADRLRALGFRGRLRWLGEAGARFLDPDDPLRKEAEASIPAEAGLTPSGTRRLLDAMARDWSMERLASLVRSDFPDPEVLDGFRPTARGERIRVIPPRLLVQVAAGNVPGTGATALLRGLLVGAPTLLKPGTGDTVLPRLMAQALREGQPTLAETFAVAQWTGGAGSALEQEALRRADCVVVYGGREAVEGVRRLADPLASVVVYGPRISLGVVLRDATRSEDLLRDAAAAIAAYEQRGCVSPQILWVEAGGGRTPEEWVEGLAQALKAHDVEEGDDRRGVPAPLAAMRSLREAAEFRAAAGESDRVFGGPSEGWMVLFEGEERPFEPSCLGRTVRVRPLEDRRRLPDHLRGAEALLQSAAVEGAEPGRTEVALLLARAGVTRVTTFEAQPWPPAWWRQDGEGPLRTLVRWVALEPAELGGVTLPPAAPSARPPSDDAHPSSLQPER